MLRLLFGLGTPIIILVSLQAQQFVLDVQCHWVRTLLPFNTLVAL